MWFNVTLSVFLIISFLVTWAGIGNILRNQQHLTEILQNIYKLLEINGEAWKQQLEFNKATQNLDHTINAVTREFIDYISTSLNAMIQPDEENSEAAKKEKKSNKEKKK